MAKETESLEELVAAIKLRHRCEATHRETVFVREINAEHQILWEGNVEVFMLMGHKKATVCYAWMQIQPNGKTKLVTMLGNRMIYSAQRAVQTAIFFDMDALPGLSQIRRIFDLSKMPSFVLE